jgi:polyisoprenyl-teichoic acid--peptidoglycan teichoic acid transferase
MWFLRRRRVLGTLAAILLVVAIPAIWLGVKWNRALTNVDKMIVAQVVLPTTSPTPQPVANELAAPAQANDVPEAIPTAVPEPNGAQNILLVGVDARPGEEVSRTDSIVLVHLDPHTGNVGMLSFPRDLWVNIPGYGKNRINTAYLTGERKLGPGYGPALLKKTVGELTGLPIDHFVMINFDGFKTVIDTLGGINVDVPKPIDDAAYPTDDYRTIKIHFDAGEQLLDGERALQYARTRHADSDFGRNQRQQQVLLAIFDRIRDQGLFGQLTNLDKYTDALSDYVRTDISRRQMLSLASLGSRLSADNIQRYAIDQKMVVAQTQPAYVLVLNDRKALKRIVSEMLDPTVVSAGGENSSR